MICPSYHPSLFQTPDHQKQPHYTLIFPGSLQLQELQNIDSLWFLSELMTVERSGWKWRICTKALSKKNNCKAFSTTYYFILYWDHEIPSLLHVSPVREGVIPFSACWHADILPGRAANQPVWHVKGCPAMCAISSFPTLKACPGARMVHIQLHESWHRTCCCQQCLENRRLPTSNGWWLRSPQGRTRKLSKTDIFGVSRGVVLCFLSLLVQCFMVLFCVSLFRTARFRSFQIWLMLSSCVFFALCYAHHNTWLNCEIRISRRWECHCCVEPLKCCTKCFCKCVPVLWSSLPFFNWICDHAQGIIPLSEPGRFQFLLAVHHSASMFKRFSSALLKIRWSVHNGVRPLLRFGILRTAWRYLETWSINEDIQSNNCIWHSKTSLLLGTYSAPKEQEHDTMIQYMPKE